MDDQVTDQPDLSQPKITLNGQEYDATEVQDFFDLGRKTREAESKFNITFDSIMPAYTKANERAKQADTFETELSEARKQLQEYQTKKESGTDTQEDLTEAREALKKLNVPLKEDLEGYIKREDLENYLGERDRKAEAIKLVNKEAEDLATEYNGKDGRPRFNKKAALAYAQAYRLGSLKEAYMDMHEDVLKDWQDAQVAGQRKPGLKTLSSQPGNKAPITPKIGNDNVGDALSEALWGGKE